MTCTRRRILYAASVCMVPTLAWANDLHRRGFSPPGNRNGFLAAAESLLAGGRPVEALDAFERIAATEHSADVELSIVRAHMQAGAYRVALAFCAHAAGAHPEFAAGTALYGILLFVGGQRTTALQTIAKSLLLHSDDRILLAAQTFISDQRPLFNSALLKAPWRVAPYASGSSVPKETRLIGTGYLLPSGDFAIIPHIARKPTQKALVRNGLGQTSTVSIVAQGPALTLVKLLTPLTQPPKPFFAGRGVIAGSPSRLIHFMAQATHEAAWPILQSSFFRVLPQNEGLRPLGFTLDTESLGGPVFDQFGQVCGLAIREQDGSDRLLPMDEVAEHFLEPIESVDMLGVAGRVVSDTKVTNDLLYERSLLCVLQVFSSPT